MSTVRDSYMAMTQGKDSSLFMRALMMPLSAAECGYGVLSNAVRVRALSRQKKLPGCVISVGNLTWGGTGKTPLVLFLIGQLVQKGHQVGVLMRGYGNDESKLIQKTFPSVSVLCGKDRYTQGLCFFNEHPQGVCVLDDGFQQWGIARTCDIVTINCTMPFGNRHLIPAGMLREPVESLQRASMVVLTHADQIRAEEKAVLRREIALWVDKDEIYEAWHMPVSFMVSSEPSVVQPIHMLRGKRVLLVAGIGAPESFKRTVEHAGIHVVDTMWYPDHYAYTNRDWCMIQERCARYPDSIVMTTEKDYMRSTCLQRRDMSIHVLRIQLEIQEHERFSDRLSRICAR